jgi:hypothetical protein
LKAVEKTTNRLPIYIYEKWSLHSFLTTASQQADVTGNILLFFCFLLFSFCKKKVKYYQPRQLVVGLLWEMSVRTISLYIYIYRKMMNLQHHHNNYTTAPYMGCDPVCGAHPHVRSCCTIIVPVKCMNQIPYI